MGRPSARARSRTAVRRSCAISKADHLRRFRSQPRPRAAATSSTGASGCHTQDGRTRSGPHDGARDGAEAERTARERQPTTTTEASAGQPASGASSRSAAQNDRSSVARALHGRPHPPAPHSLDPSASLSPLCCIPVKTRPVHLDSRVELHSRCWLHNYLFTVKNWHLSCSSTPESS